jgi:hypothetical protein
MSRLEPTDRTTYRAELWRFLLLRVIHDLGNSISGILTLSEHHLRHDLPTEDVTDSFRLIRESAETSREMLMTVGSLADDESQGPELVRVPEFLTDLLAQMTRIVPRNMSIHLTGELSDAIIQVDPFDLRRAFIGLAAADYFAFGAKPCTIRLGGEAEPGKIWLVYRSNRQSDFNLGHHATRIFEKVDPPPDSLVWSETEEELTLRIGYAPAVL